MPNLSRRQLFLYSSAALATMAFPLKADARSRIRMVLPNKELINVTVTKNQLRILNDFFIYGTAAIDENGDRVDPSNISRLTS